MELAITLIRSGMTAAGKAGRFEGTNNEPLLKESVKEIEKKVRFGIYPQAEIVYASSLARSVETARLIYPKNFAVVFNGLRDYDYGAYTNMTYAQILRQSEFLPWAYANELVSFKNGDKPYAYAAGVQRAFRQVVEEMLMKGIQYASVITHQLAIKMILQRFCIPRNYYKDWQIPWGGGYTLEYRTAQSAAVVVSSF